MYYNNNNSKNVPQHIYYVYIRSYNKKCFEALIQINPILLSWLTETVLVHMFKITSEIIMGTQNYLGEHFETSAWSSSTDYIHPNEK